jgi:hypothetical protein
VPGGAAFKPTLDYVYDLRFGDREGRSFLVRLDPDSLENADPIPADAPEWTRLDFHRCPVCPLDAAKQERCPVAVRMVDLVDYFKDFVSHVEVDATVRCPDREYFRRTTVQHALSSLAGVYMVTSGCPVLDRMRPMVETHMPFATRQETMYRTITMYLFAQSTLLRHGFAADWTLGGLMTYLYEVGEVNNAFCERLAGVPQKGDATLNALAILDSLAALTGISIGGGRLAHWDVMFLRHWAG